MLDVIVVGAGHNGIVCANRLAKAGARVVLLEAAAEPGGMLGATEFHPGFFAPSCVAHWPVTSAAPFAELGLQRHGLEFVDHNSPTLALHKDGAIDVYGRRTASDGITAFNDAVLRYTKALDRLVESPPPISHDGRDVNRGEATRILLSSRRVGRDDFREILRLIGTNVYDWSEEWFDDEPIRAALGLEAVMGHFAGPRSPGTVLSFLLRQMLGAGLQQPQYRQVGSALRRAMQAAGVHLRTDTAVREILVESGRVTGVVLANGDTLRALHVVSTLDPRKTIFGLAGAQHFETGFLKPLNHYRANGCVARLLLALSGPPKFSKLQSKDLNARLLLVQDRAELERAFDAAKYRQYSQAPAMEVTVPTTMDAELAPTGQHILCANVIYAPANLAGGWDQAARAGFIECAMRTLEQHAPGIGEQVIASQLLTPLDLEQEFGVTGGHWHHGELAADQFWAMRPVPGAARYRLPVSGLYLGGAGAHPGGGVHGWPGALAAAAVLEDNAR